MPTSVDPTGFGTVAGLPWDDGTTFIVGGGPSLTGFDFERLLGAAHVIGVNESMFRIPCSVGVSIDVNFIRYNYTRLAAFTAAGGTLYLALGEKWPAVLDLVPGATYLRGIADDGLSLYSDTVRHGGTSGYAALNVAVLKHAKRIVLLGFDYGALAGAHHYHGAYHWYAVDDPSWTRWATRFDNAARDCAALGIEVVNASPHSAVTAFPKVSIDQCLS